MDVATSAPVTTVSMLGSLLAAITPDLRQACSDPWILIGSAAALLVGAEVVVADLDILTSVRDAEAMSETWHERLDGQHAPDGADRFRSHFARFSFSSLPVEVMGGLEVMGIHGWDAVQINETITVICTGMAIPVPSIAEQMRVLKIFGRPKDLRRAALLQSLIRSRTC